MKPWGHIDWLLPYYPKKLWHLICCASFEERSTTVPQHLGEKNIITYSTVIRIDDPTHPKSEITTALTDKSEIKILDCLQGHKKFDAKLMVAPIFWDNLVTEICSEQKSIILDVTTLPKRAALFMLRRLIESCNVENLIVCYSVSESYTEKSLTYDMKPPSVLPGFGKTQSETDNNVIVISVGYSSFDLGDLLEQEQSTDVHFLVPFPPASPSFRRNWKFLQKLVADAASRNQEIKRIHANDMFQVYEWLVGNNWENRGITMLPLGPKPHSIAMSLAQLKFNGWGEIVYPQPQRYNPNYSSGPLLLTDGTPDILAYGLRREGQDVL